MHDREALGGQHGIGNRSEHRQVPVDRRLGDHAVGAARVPGQDDVRRQIQHDGDGRGVVSAGTFQHGGPRRGCEARGIDDRRLPCDQARLEGPMQGCERGAGHGLVCLTPADPRPKRIRGQDIRRRKEPSRPASICRSRPAR